MFFQFTCWGQCMAGTVCLEMLQSWASENPGLSHLSIPLFLVHQVSVLSPLRPKPLPAPKCLLWRQTSYVNPAYWDRAERDSGQQWPGGLLQSEVVTQEDHRPQNVLGLLFTIASSDSPDGSAWVGKGLNCQGGPWCCHSSVVGKP